MDNLPLVEEIHTKYAKQIGSDQIATKLALSKISEYIELNVPESVLEIGSGIGTITDLLIRRLQKADILCYEVNLFCLEQLKKNVSSSRIVIIDNLSELQKINRHIDFIIIDDLIDKQTTFELIRQTTPLSVFIEGHRRIQRLHVMLAYKNIGKSFSFKDIKKTGDSHKGGCFISLETNSTHKGSMSTWYVRFTLVYSKVIEIRSKVSSRKFLIRNIS